MVAAERREGDFASEKLQHKGTLEKVAYFQTPAGQLNREHGATLLLFPSCSRKGLNSPRLDPPP